MNRRLDPLDLLFCLFWWALPLVYAFVHAALAVAGSRWYAARKGQTHSFGDYGPIPPKP